jgi:hypothetical protein
MFASRPGGGHPHGKGSHVPGHAFRETSEEMPTKGRPCYVFNNALRRELNDTDCSHCRHYLTYRCPHLDEFLDNVDELSPD